MDSSGASAAVGLFGLGLAFLTITWLVIIVLLVIARWKVFTKAGEAGWKSLIPVYAEYIQWKIAWTKTSLFWVVLILVIGGFIMTYAAGGLALDAYGNLTPTGDFSLFSIIGTVLIIAGGVLELIACYKLFVSFGHGVGWFILYILFPNIMLLVLGFGSSQYRGPQD